MELRHLRYFVAVAEEASFTRAAGRLHVTQPALSRQIRDLEQELGTELIIRGNGGSGITLSPAGASFLADARQILDLSASAALSVRKFAACREHSIAVGYIAPALGSFLTTSLQIFSQRHPKVDVSIFELSPAEQTKALREGRLDIALVGQACDELENEFDFFSVRKVPVGAVVPENHPLARRKAVRLAELQHERFVALNPDRFPGRNEFIRDACRRAGFVPEFGPEADGLATALAIIARAGGVGLMPDEVRELPHRHVVFLEVDKPRLSIDFRAIVCQGERRASVRALLSEFRATAAAR